jgi:hypothetical protein
LNPFLTITTFGVVCAALGAFATKIAKVRLLVSSRLFDHYSVVPTKENPAEKKIFMNFDNVELYCNMSAHYKFG